TSAAPATTGTGVHGIIRAHDFIKQAFRHLISLWLIAHKYYPTWIGIPGCFSPNACNTLASWPGFILPVSSKASGTNFRNSAACQAFFRCTEHSLIFLIARVVPQFSMSCGQPIGGSGSTQNK